MNINKNDGNGNGNGIIAGEIKRLKEEKNALVLAHYYQTYDIQCVADFCGDSFELAKRAKASDKDIIVFCGVKFMGESAKILNPGKRVFLPRTDAGCPMADMVTPEDVKNLRAAHPDAEVVCYINSSAATKAVSDVCVTSSNAERIVRKLDAEKVIFIPDKNLGGHIAAKLPEKEFVFHNGWCPIHNTLDEKTVRLAKEKYPNALLAAHPECDKAVLKYCDFIGSTSEILDWCRKSEEKSFLIGTETGVVERLSSECPEKKFILVSECLVCEDMKKTTLEGLRDTLRDLTGEVIMTKEEMDAARKPLERMLELGSN